MVIFRFKNLKYMSNLSFDLLVLSLITSLYFSNSSNINSGANKSSSSTRNKLDVLLSLINAANKMFASTTIFNNQSPFEYLAANALFTFLPSSIASSSSMVLLDLNSSKNSKSAIFCTIDFLATSDQLISLKRSMRFFKPAGIDKVRLAMLPPYILCIMYTNENMNKSFIGVN